MATQKGLIQELLNALINMRYGMLQEEKELPQYLIDAIYHAEKYLKHNV